MKNVAVILARGGSKGIPDKNIIDLNGKPLIYYSIKSAILSNVDETWISTDSEKIAEIAERFEAKILMRPEELATDTSKSEDALVHFCENVASDLVVFIQPTSPLVLPKDINVGLKMMNDYDSVFSGYREHWIPRWKDYGDLFVEHQWNKNQRPRRQDRSELIVENGAFYITKRDSLLKNKLRYNSKIGFVEMPYSRSFQVDNYDDLFIIESIMKNKNSEV